MFLDEAIKVVNYVLFDEMNTTFFKVNSAVIMLKTICKLTALNTLTA
jgi:hypothetical protein